MLIPLNLSPGNRLNVAPPTSADVVSGDVVIETVRAHDTMAREPPSTQWTSSTNWINNTYQMNGDA